MWRTETNILEGDILDFEFLYYCLFLFSKLPEGTWVSFVLELDFSDLTSLQNLGGIH
jgi:hypothetical protein